uniref:Putative secreted peptide n=1 Tax=Anopheles braziliensis TaxID=58242 RepID=A0A2M3ZMG3_9DIPT
MVLLFYVLFVSRLTHLHTTHTTHARTHFNPTTRLTVAAPPPPPPPAHLLPLFPHTSAFFPSGFLVHCYFLLITTGN